MIRYIESIDSADKLTDKYIKDSLEAIGFEEMTSSDEYVMKFSKIEFKLDDSEVSIEVYKDDIEDKYSLSVIVEDIDYANLSDYFDTKEEFDDWIDNDYNNIIDEIYYQM